MPDYWKLFWGWCTSKAPFTPKSPIVARKHNSPTLKLFEGWCTGGGPPSSNSNPNHTPQSHTCEAWWKHLWSNLVTVFFFKPPGCLIAGNYFGGRCTSKAPLQPKKHSTVADPNLKLSGWWCWWPHVVRMLSWFVFYFLHGFVMDFVQ